MLKAARRGRSAAAEDARLGSSSGARRPMAAVCFDFNRSSVFAPVGPSQLTSCAIGSSGSCRASAYSLLILALIPCESVAPLPSSRPALTSTACARWGAGSAIDIASTCVRASARRSSGRSAPARPWLTMLLASLRRLMATRVSLTRRGSKAAAGLRPGSANYPSEGSYLGSAPSTVRRAASARVQP